MSKKITKKVAAKKKVAPMKVPKQVKEPKSSAKFVSFSLGVTIPTQQYGNMTPKIEVTANSYEDALAFAMPKILELYAQYVEETPGKPKFLGKITETVKVVATPVAQVTSPSVHTPAASTTPPAVPVPPASVTPVPEKPKADAVLKAEKAISLAMTYDAANAIQEQIQNSVKIPPEDKGPLFELCLKKKKELQK